MSKNAASILTTAMQNAEADETMTAPAEEPNDTITITINKTKIKKVLLGSLAGAAIGYVASRLLASTNSEDTDETTED